MSIPTFDLSLLPPAALSLRLVGGAIESPRAVSGLTGAIDLSGGGFWTLKLSRVQLFADPAGHRAWLMLDGLLANGVGKVIVPTINDLAMPGAAAGVSGAVGPVPHSDGAMFSDGGGHLGSRVVGEFAAAAARGAATVSLRLLTGGPLVWGVDFSLRHPAKGWRRYRVTEIDSVDGDVWTVGIRPPLREAVPVGQFCDWWRPRCVMRLPAGQSLGWEPEKFWHSTPDVTLVEAMEDV